MIWGLSDFHIHEKHIFHQVITAMCAVGRCQDHFFMKNQTDRRSHGKSQANRPGLVFENFSKLHQTFKSSLSTFV